MFQAAVNSPNGLANLFHLSPHTKATIKRNATKGVMRTSSRATPDPERRNFFMERVGQCYAPIITKICSIPQFNGQPRPERVLEQVVRRCSKKRKGMAVVNGKLKRKMVFYPPNATSTTAKAPASTPLEKAPTSTQKSDVPIPISKHQDNLLRDMASSWKQARRNYDRDSAARILQITLKTIPKFTGILFRQCTCMCIIITCDTNYLPCMPNKQVVSATG